MHPATRPQQRRQGSEAEAAQGADLLGQVLHQARDEGRRAAQQQRQHPLHACHLPPSQRQHTRGKAAKMPTPDARHWPRVEFLRPRQIKVLDSPPCRCDERTSSKVRAAAEKAQKEDDKHVLCSLRSQTWGEGLQARDLAQALWGRAKPEAESDGSLPIPADALRRRGCPLESRAALHRAPGRPVRPPFSPTGNAARARASRMTQSLPSVLSEPRSATLLVAGLLITGLSLAASTTGSNGNSELETRGSASSNNSNEMPGSYRLENTRKDGEADREQPSRNRADAGQHRTRRRQEPRPPRRPRDRLGLLPLVPTSPVSLSSTCRSGRQPRRGDRALWRTPDCRRVRRAGGLEFGPWCRPTTSSALAMSCASRCGARSMATCAPPWTAAAASSYRASAPSWSRACGLTSSTPP